MDATAELAWQHGLWDSKPLWPSEPSIAHLEQIAREHLRLADGEPCSVAFFAEGAFNKLYDVAAPGREPCLVRVTLPVDPRRKTLSEVATVAPVRARCRSLRALVPCVLAYDADARPYERMIMEMMRGAVLDARWTAMSLDAKETLVNNVVAYRAEPFDHTLRAIGNLYPDESESVARIVPIALF